MLSKKRVHLQWHIIECVNQQGAQSLFLDTEVCSSKPLSGHMHSMSVNGHAKVKLPAYILACLQ